MLDFDKVDALYDRQGKIGTFMPKFIHHPSEPPVALYPTIPEDVGTLIKVSKLVGGFVAVRAEE